MTQKDASRWQGHGTIEPDGDTFAWKPGPEVAWHAAADFQLRLRERRSSTKRLILPVGGFVTKSESNRIESGAFLYAAQQGGLAILLARGLDAEGQQRHDTAFLYVQKMINSRTWLRRRFTGPIDFKVSPLVQEKLGETTVVPAGFDSKPLDAESLMELGKAEAERRGIVQPGREQAIQFGLYVAAKRDPLPPDSLTQDQIRWITRSALLDPMMAPNNVSDDELQMVTERFADAVDPHLDDDLREFDNWLLGPNNSVVTQIAKRKKARGGELAKERVTAALAELGWRSLSHWALCVETQMRCVAADLPEPLSPPDRPLFELTYLRQPWLGGSLSLCLLAERFRFLQEAVLDLIEDPADVAAQGTLLRMLQYYATASTTRREVDRQCHQLREEKTEINQARDTQRRTPSRWQAPED